MRMSEKEIFLMIPKKLIMTWIISYVALIGIILGVAVWSNQQWCGIVTIFNETYKTKPSPTITGQELASEFKKLQNRFLC
jgi:hypothetical protein